MNWDDFGTVDEGESGVVEQLCPEGVHTAEIKFVDIVERDYAKHETANPKGKCVRIAMHVRKGVKDVWDTIPCHRRATIEALCRSARIDPPRGDWDERELKGQTVTFESVISLSKKGNDYVLIKGYKPNTEPLPKEIRDRPARTPTQKADAATNVPNDDIPF
jgi:hypothetical protein